MNSLLIIGNLCDDPKQRVTQAGDHVTSFPVAVSRRGKNGAADYFRVTAWRDLGDNCMKYLTKGKKVAVVGHVSVSTYTKQNGETKATLEINAERVEFLSPKSEPQEEIDKHEPNYVEVTDEKLPF